MLEVLNLDLVLLFAVFELELEVRPVDPHHFDFVPQLIDLRGVLPDILQILFSMLIQFETVRITQIAHFLIDLLHLRIVLRHHPVLRLPQERGPRLQLLNLSLELMHFIV